VPNVTINVSDPELLAWLGDLKKGVKDEEVERTLRVGKMVLGFARLSVNDSTLDGYFSPMTERMDELGTTLDRILTRSRQSEGRGKLGEQAVITTLQTGNRLDRFEPVGNKPQSSDIEVEFEVRGTPTAALVEVKTYSSTVPSGVLKKFRDDLAAQGRDYGLLVALGQSIATVPQRVVVEESRTGLTMILTNVDHPGLLLGYDLFKKLVERHRLGARWAGQSLDRAWTQLNVELDEIAQLDKLASDLEAQARESNASAQATLTKASGLRHLLQLTVHRLRSRVQGELGDSATTSSSVEPAECTSTPVTQPTPEGARRRAPRAPPVAITEGVVGLAWVASLLEAIRDANVEVTVAGKHWTLVRGGKALGMVTADMNAPLARLVSLEGFVGPLNKGEHIGTHGRLMTITGPAVDFGERLGRRLAER
jgi:hypothetical protein